MQCATAGFQIFYRKKKQTPKSDQVKKMTIFSVVSSIYTSNKILQKLLYEEPFTTVRPQLYFNFDLEKNSVLVNIK